MRVKKIYVPSPYTKPKEVSDILVRALAIHALSEANKYYGNQRVDLFSPVLTNMYVCENLTYDDAMSICFKQLSSCDELFIGDAVSKGIVLEYEYALNNGIPVVFKNEYVKNNFMEEKDEILRG